MEKFEECVEKLTGYAIVHSAGMKDTDEFFDAMEGILDICAILRENFSDRRGEFYSMLSDPSEVVRLVASFCVLEGKLFDGEAEALALKNVTDFLNGSYGIQHIVWLTWLEEWGIKNDKKIPYTPRAELLPLKKNYAEKWLKILNEKTGNSDSEGELVSFPSYPFDSFDFIDDSDDGDDDGEGDFPF